MQVNTREPASARRVEHGTFKGPRSGMDGDVKESIPEINQDRQIFQAYHREDCQQMLHAKMHRSDVEVDPLHLVAIEGAFTSWSLSDENL